jgi:hypothetical protein
MRIDFQEVCRFGIMCLTITKIWEISVMLGNL